MNISIYWLKDIVLFKNKIKNPLWYFVTSFHGNLKFIFFINIQTTVKKLWETLLGLYSWSYSQVLWYNCIMSSPLLHVSISSPGLPHVRVMSPFYCRSTLSKLTFCQKVSLVMDFLRHLNINMFRRLLLT